MFVIESLDLYHKSPDSSEPHTDVAGKARQLTGKSERSDSRMRALRPSASKAAGNAEASDLVRRMLRPTGVPGEEVVGGAPSISMLTDGAPASSMGSGERMCPAFKLSW